MFYGVLFNLKQHICPDIANKSSLTILIGKYNMNHIMYRLHHYVTEKTNHINGRDILMKF